MAAAVAAASVLSLSACSSPSGPSQPTSPPEGLGGAWALPQPAKVFAVDPVMQLNALRFEDDGSVSVFLVGVETGANDCVAAGYREADALTVRVEQGLLEGEVITLHRSPDDPDALEADVPGDTPSRVTLRREAAVPPASDCDPFLVDERFQVPKPRESTDLVLVGRRLMYVAENDSVIAFDLDTKSTVTTAGAQGWSIQSLAAGFWATREDDPERVGRVSFGSDPPVTTFDVVDTDSLGAATAIEAAALRTTGQLWLHGIQAGTGTRRFVLLDTTQDPPRLDDTVGFDRRIHGMSFDGQNLWAIMDLASKVLVGIDVAKLGLLGGLDLPAGVLWTGVHADPGSFYLLGIDDSGGVIVRMARERVT